MAKSYLPTLANQEEIKTKVGVPEDDALENPITLFSGIKSILGKFKNTWTDARAVKVDSINDHVIHITENIDLSSKFLFPCTTGGTVVPVLSTTRTVSYSGAHTYGLFGKWVPPKDGAIAITIGIWTTDTGGMVFYIYEDNALGLSYASAIGSKIVSPNAMPSEALTHVAWHNNSRKVYEFVIPVKKGHTLLFIGSVLNSGKQCYCDQIDIRYTVEEVT